MAGLPAGLRRRLPDRPAARPPTSTGCAASSTGSTTPSNSARPGIALGPIFASRTHGYDTTDHYRIDPRLGDDGDFDHLVAEAHRRGLRVLLDGVFNHVGSEFARYRDRRERRHVVPAGAATTSTPSRGTASSSRSITTIPTSSTTPST